MNAIQDIDESPTRPEPDAPAKVLSGNSDASGPADLPPIIIPEWGDSEEADEKPSKVLTYLHIVNLFNLPYFYCIILYKHL
jgi:hypothetical protein